MALGELFRGRPVAAMQEQMRAFAMGFGVKIASPDHLPNTQKALAIAELARDRGRLHPWRDAVMDAHWQDERDIEDEAELRSLANEAGLDPEEALAATRPGAYTARVRALGEEAARWGVTGIPTWFLLPSSWTPGTPVPSGGPRPVKVVGCQPWAVLEKAAAAAGAAPR